MKKLLALFPHRHQPDANQLSALLDGRLDPAASAAAATHVASCAACAARLEELRRVRTMLTAMPQADAPRSFRLRQADVDKAPARATGSPALRLAPVLGGVAMAVFVVVLGADFATRSGDSDSSATAMYANDGSLASTADRAAGEAEAGVAAPGPTGGIAADNAPVPMSPDAAARAPADADAPPAVEPDTAAPEAASPAGDAYAATTPQRDGSDDAAAESAPQPETEQVKSLNDTADDDDGRTAFRITEAAALAVGLGALAIGAGAWIAKKRGTP